MSTFKEYHIAEELVDRTEEFDELLPEILQTNKSNGTIICAYTGVGKTALSSKIVKHLDDTYKLVINIKTDPENSSTNYKEGKFLANIFAEAVEITNSLPEKKYAFSYFISHSKNKNLKKARRERFFEDIFNADTLIMLFKVVGYHIFKRLLKLGEFNSDFLINEDRSSSIRIMNYYLQYLFSNLKIFLKLDNIQNVDDTSLTYILGWMNDGKNNGHYFLYEYTIDNNNTFQKAIQLTEKFKDTGISIKLRKLEFLEEDDAVKALKIATPDKSYTTEDENAIKYYYNNIGCGNIRKLIDYDCDSANNCSDLYDPTYEKLRVLEKEELYIIAVIILCNGSISTTFYEGIFQDDPLIRNKIKTFENLSNQENRILELDNGNVKIEHASIIDSWNKHETEFLEYSLLAYSRLQEFLKSGIDSQTPFYISKQKATILLLQLYKKFDFELIIDLLDEVNALSRDELSVDNVWEILKIIVDATKENAFSYIQIYKKIIQICFNCELYENGLECIKLLELHSQSISAYFYIYKCLFLSALDRHNDSIIVACTILTTWKNDSRTELNAKLILLNNNRSINHTAECKKIGNDIEQNAEYKSFPEYGYFLRLTCLYLERQISLEKVKQSVKFFKEIDNSIQQGKSLITYATHLAVMGQLKEAKKALAKSEKKLKKAKFGRHMLLVNRAAIMLLDNDFSEEVWDLLDQSELSAVVPFDKLAILNNKLIWCIENKAFTKADLIVNQISRLFAFEPDKHLHSFMNYNLYLFYSDLGVITEAEKFYKRADELKEYCLTLNMRMTQKNDEKRNFLLSKRWHVCFLEYWTFDVLMQ